MSDRPCSRWLEQAIYDHAQELTVEMNLRLFLDGEKGFCWEADPDRTLFVESISVVDIRYPEYAKSKGRSRRKGIYRIGRFLSVIWRWLRGTGRRKKA